MGNTNIAAAHPINHPGSSRCDTPPPETAHRPLYAHSPKGPCQAPSRSRRICASCDFTPCSAIHQRILSSSSSNPSIQIACRFLLHACLHNGHGLPITAVGQSPGCARSRTILINHVSRNQPLHNFRSVKEQHNFRCPHPQWRRQSRNGPPQYCHKPVHRGTCRYLYERVTNYRQQRLKYRRRCGDNTTDQWHRHCNQLHRLLPLDD